MEEVSNFKYVWAEWIVPLINDLYAQTDEKFRKYCNVQIRDLQQICNNAERYYQQKREETKKFFMENIIEAILKQDIEWIFTRLVPYYAELL